MSLSHLDQVIELERGEAALLWWAVADCGRRNLIRLTHSLGQVEQAGIVPALACLERVAKRLKRVEQREQLRIGKPRLKPVNFRLRVDELVAIMLYVYPVSYSAPVPLGKVQQKSLNLSHLIDFTG